MGTSRFYGLLSALLFAAVCAYIAAALCCAFTAQPVREIPVSDKNGGGELRGLLIRREGPAPKGLNLSALERIPVGDSTAETAIFYPFSDGYEYLSPDNSEGFSAEELRSILVSSPNNGGGAKLIYGFDCYYAAFYCGSDDIEPGPCRLRFEGQSQSRRAELITVSPSDTECVLLFRLMLDKELLGLRFCRAELLY